MKKTILFAGICTALVISSCAKEQVESVSEGETLVKAELLPSDTKTIMGEKTEGVYPVTWQATDAININGVASTSVSVKEPATSAVFTIGGVVIAPYCAVYPASAYVADSYNSSDRTVRVNVPAVQTYTAGSFDSAAGIMVGHSEEEGGVNFKHAMAYLKLTVSGGSTSAAVRTVTVVSEDHRRISGEFTADCSESGDFLVIPSSLTGTSITLDCGETGVAQGTPMFIALPAQTHPTGLHIRIEDVNGDSMEVTAYGSKTLVAGHVYPTTIAYTAEEFEPVTFPLYFPIGYPQDLIEGGKSTGVGYCNVANQPMWRPSSNSADDGIYITNLLPYKGMWSSVFQPQATCRWRWVNAPEAYRKPGQSYNCYIEFTGGSKNSTTLLSGVGVKGIWTGDYFEFDIPVKNFAANTKLRFTFAVCNKNAPTFWEVKYLDGDIWKSTASAGCMAPDGETTATATWAIPYNYAPKLSTDMLFENAVACGHLYVRLVCMDGSIITTGLNTVEKGRTYPYGSTGCTANFYLCEKSADVNPDTAMDNWGNGIPDQTQSISFTIVE